MSQYSRVGGEAIGFPMKREAIQPSFCLGGESTVNHDCTGAAAVLSSALVNVGVLGLGSNPIPLNLVASTPDFQFDTPGVVIIKECGKYFLTLTVALNLSVAGNIAPDSVIEVVKTDCKGRRQTIAFLNPNILNIAGLVGITLEGASGPFFDCLEPGDRLEVVAKGLVDISVSVKLFLAKIDCCCDDIKCGQNCSCK